MTEQRRSRILEAIDQRDLKRRRLATHLQKIEGNPLTDEDLALFEMLDRQDWSPERRVAYIIEKTLASICK